MLPAGTAGVACLNPIVREGFAGYPSPPLQWESHSPPAHPWGLASLHWERAPHGALVGGRLSHPSSGSRMEVATSPLVPVQGGGDTSQRPQERTDPGNLPLQTE